MFTRVSPRLDAVEEVTIGTAANGADMAGQGAVQIKFVTRSGTNEYHGSAYYYLRRDWMNSNTWFNLHRNVDVNGHPTDTPVQKQFQPGGRLGGPIRIPKLFNGRDKLFFFVNYEWVSSPGTSTSTRTIMSPLSEQGVFQYAGGPNIDLMALAARNNQTSKIDPLVAKLLGDVRKSTAGGVVNATTDPLTQSFAWQQGTTSKTTFPTVRIDYNVTTNHRLTGSITQNHLISDPDTTNSVQAVYPGFPAHGLQDSTRYSGQGSWRWTLSSRIVNEFRFGKTGGATQFSPDLVSEMFQGSGFGGMNGYAISWSNFKSMANPYPSSAVSSREGKTMVFEDNISWVKGAHLLSMGVSYTKAEVWLYNRTKAPVLTLGFTSSGDPADAMFTNTANFPGASSTDITNARNLYAVLTGRVNAITRNARIQPDGSTYKILGASDQYGTLSQWGSFINDSWRVKPTVTINAGLRYDVQRPFYAQNNSYSTATIDDLFGVTGVGSDFQPGSVVNHLGNLFRPATLQGSATTFKQLQANTNAYHTDWGGLAPSLGAAWTVGSDSGILHAILGSKGNSVLRAGASLAYQRGGMSDFTGVYGSNSGISIDASRNQTNYSPCTVELHLWQGVAGAVLRVSQAVRHDRAELHQQWIRQRDGQRPARRCCQLAVRTAFWPGQALPWQCQWPFESHVGGWSYEGVARIQSGRMVDFGNVRLNGMTADDVSNAYQMRQVTDPQNKYRTLAYMLPQDIIDNTIKAFSVNATGYTNGAPAGRYFAPANSPNCIETVNGFGDCGVRSLIVTGPKVVRFDMNIIKKIPLTERVVIEGQAQVFNVFNNVNFNPVSYTGRVSDSYQVTGAIDQSRTMQLAFRINF